MEDLLLLRQPSLERPEEIRKALDQISEIHGHLAKTDVYRGYRAVPVVLSGVLALVAAGLQGPLGGVRSAHAYLLYWTCIAVAGAATAGSGVVYSYLLEESRIARRRTRTTVGQLLPCIVAGTVVTVLVGGGAPERVAVVPGLWAILFSLGIFASRPYLPRAIGWVALYYLTAGAVLLMMAGDSGVPSPWEPGLTFGLGQFLSAIVLCWDLERKRE